MSLLSGLGLPIQHDAIQPLSVARVRLELAMEVVVHRGGRRRTCSPQLPLVDGRGYEGDRVEP